ncbi:hypothetical protein ACFZA2_07160 [Microbacterium sp. NPDC007973]|uniref:hypothetical protein n=1 Tax=Microbacterium sp. NPDC007973 TaxID=3364182 RepID=UPI0036EA2973
MSGTLSRDDIIDGLRELVSRLRAAGKTATIQIVGGAAIALTIDGDRPATTDVDGPVTPLHDVQAVAATIAMERNWPLDWVNDKARIFLPDGMGRPAEWMTLHNQDGILIEVASPAMLLAMKLRAFERRGPRDGGDVALLLAVLRIQTADAAEELLDEFFPAEGLRPATYDRVAGILESAPLEVPHRPSAPDFS